MSRYVHLFRFRKVKENKKTRVFPPPPNPSEGVTFGGRGWWEKLREASIGQIWGGSLRHDFGFYGTVWH